MGFANSNFGDEEKCKDKTILLGKNLRVFCRDWENFQTDSTSVDVDLKNWCD